MTLFRNGRELTCTMPTFEALQNPDSPEAQEVFRRADELANEERRRRQNANFFKCGANKKDLNEAGFEKYITWENNQNQVALRDLCLQFEGLIQREPECNNILFMFGKAGAGKTYFSLSVLKMLCGVEKPRQYITRYVPKRDGEGNPINDGEDVKVSEDSGVIDYWSGYYTTSEHLCEVISMNFKSTTQRENDKAKLDKFKHAKLLIIDEIGRSLQSKKNEKDALFSVINARISNYLPTILCSNMNERELQELFGDALWTRISSVAKLFCTDGIDNMRAPRVQKILRERR